MIGLHEPLLAGNEWRYVKECLDSGWVSSSGKFVERFENAVKEYTGAYNAVSCVTGSAALQVALQIAGINHDDEVIVPSLTFISSINAINHNGAHPVFMDADKYYNIDVDKTEAFLETQTELREGSCWNSRSGRRIAAILVVHVFGNAARLEPLLELSNHYKIHIIEDAAESLGTVYSEGPLIGRHPGTIGKLGCLSFNGNKIITAGGGGMILTNDKEMADKARYLTTQAKDDPIRYIHNEVGYNFRLTNVQAALGLAQLEQLPSFLGSKKNIFNQYETALNNIDGLTLANVPEYAQNNHWLNVLQINDDIFKDDIDSLGKKLYEKGVQTRPVWTLNHLQKSYKSCQNFNIEKAEHLVKNSLCLPSSANLTFEKINHIIRQL